LQEQIKTAYEGEILYSDTDSVYCVIPNKYADMDGFALATTLGVKNEMKIKDANEWVCIGAKSYAYTNGKGKYS
jgi:DNA polymerase elongation subunit (family B)